MLHNLIDLSSETDIIYKSVALITTYLTKGVPRTIYDEK